MSSSLHSKTPLIYSSKLTQIFGKGPVYLKLENLQEKNILDISFR
jgi:threonine dehydratase